MQNAFQPCLLVITYSQHINIFFTLQITPFTKCVFLEILPMLTPL